MQSEGGRECRGEECRRGRECVRYFMKLVSRSRTTSVVRGHLSQDLKRAMWTSLKKINHGGCYWLSSQHPHSPLPVPNRTVLLWLWNSHVTRRKLDSTSDFRDRSRFVEALLASQSHFPVIDWFRNPGLNYLMQWIPQSLSLVQEQARNLSWPKQI